LQRCKPFDFLLVLCGCYVSHQQSSIRSLRSEAAPVERAVRCGTWNSSPPTKQARHAGVERCPQWRKSMLMFGVIRWDGDLSRRRYGGWVLARRVSLSMPITRG
jgi:hypothetical protein